MLSETNRGRGRPRTGCVSPGLDEMPQVDVVGKVGGEFCDLIVSMRGGAR
jgi:hypothetical protein